MEKTTVYLPPELQVELRAAAKRLGKPQAQIVRDAVAAYVADLPDWFPKGCGIGEDATLDARDLERVLDAEWGGRDHP